MGNSTLSTNPSTAVSLTTPPETWLGQDLSQHILMLTKVQGKADVPTKACAALHNLVGHAFKTAWSYQAIRLSPPLIK